MWKILGTIVGLLIAICLVLLAAYHGLWEHDYAQASFELLLAYGILLLGKE